MNQIASATAAPPKAITLHGVVHILVTAAPAEVDVPEPEDTPDAEEDGGIEDDPEPEPELEPDPEPEPEPEPLDPPPLAWAAMAVLDTKPLAKAQTVVEANGVCSSPDVSDRG
ncbi:hypothetical protein M433DRAFT_139178 [Acidomyces richmondensis BFW]|nr:hypothetical protein M433DRAFT_139178 [Acidomyces richmondensis BFW]